MRRHSSIALGFLALIFAGAVALAAPFAQVSGAWGDFYDNIFTAFSAVCVTGLTVVDVAATYTREGQYVLIFLVEVGCLGLMTCGTFILIAIGRRLSLSREFSLMNAYGVAQVQGLRGLICWVVGSMAVIETIGALLYWMLLPSVLPGRDDYVYLAFFYSVMSFCNAGFGILPGSLAAFAKSPALVAVSAALTILGGIGFLVIYNLCTCRLLRGKNGARGNLSLHTKIVLRYTVYLLSFTFVAFVAVEWTRSLDGLPVWEKLWTAFYQAVTPRTCGFCIIPTESLQPLTRLVYEMMMFIGGAPGSAAAGIKLTTFAVLCYTLTALCRGENETIIRRKTIPVAVVRESLVILMALIVITAVVTGWLFWTEAARVAAGQVTLDALFFEAVSAVTTTGLSVGTTTADLTAWGRGMIILAMFTGRLGALTLVMMIGDKETVRRVRFPTEEVIVG